MINFHLHNAHSGAPTYAFVINIQHPSTQIPLLVAPTTFSHNLMMNYHLISTTTARIHHCGTKTQLPTTSKKN
jgi:hypothetical protein